MRWNCVSAETRFGAFNLNPWSDSMLSHRPACAKRATCNDAFPNGIGLVSLEFHKRGGIARLATTNCGADGKYIDMKKPRPGSWRGYVAALLMSTATRAFPRGPLE